MGRPRPGDQLFAVKELAPIFVLSSQEDYGDKPSRNKQTGPGGSARRLHQISLRALAGLSGADTGSTDV